MSLVAQYKLNERSGTSIADFVGTNTGTSANAVSPVAGPGDDTGLLFNGSNDKITVVADPFIDINGKTTLSISAWINPSSDGERNVGRICDKTAATAAGYHFEVRNEVGSQIGLRFVIIHDGATNTDAQVDNGVVLNTWSHVAVIYNEDSAKKGKVYINGVLQSLDNDGAGDGTIIDDSTVDLTIGNRDNAGDPDTTFDGTISDVRIYDEALSQNRIVQIMNESLYDRTLRNRSRR